VRRFSGGAGVAAGVQGFEAPMLGGALDVTGRFGSWQGRVELGVRATLGAQVMDDSIAVSLLLAGARIEACRAWQPGVELVLCAGLLIQRLQGAASGLSSPDEEAVWLPGAGGTLLAKSALRGPVRLWAAAQLDVRYHEVNYEVQERGPVGQLGRVSAVLLAGPEIRF
jgi:hypothetical protein